MTSIETILICGGGLAGNMTATALAHILPKDIELILLDVPGSSNTDMLYGTVTSPLSYNFHLKMGITEPELLLETDTAFSLGTRYVNWGAQGRSWVQSFHIPLPIFEGVDFHHFITRRHKLNSEPCSLEPYIMSIEAAYKGVFAHPPEQRNTPLASVEYGYQFSPDNWADFYAKSIDQKRVTRLSGEIGKVHHEGDIVRSLSLKDGRKIDADLYIDCSGQKSEILSCFGIERNTRHSLRAMVTHQPLEKLGAVCRTLTAMDFGWSSETPLQTGTRHLTVYHPESESAALQSHGTPDCDPDAVQLGQRGFAWRGNCVALGHAAAVLEPLSPAPIMLLQRDIERLLELIPVSEDMTVERREYNRRFTDDYNHATLFQRALFEITGQPDTAYWQAARAQPVCDKLLAKLTQFKSRGTFVQYDYELFNQQDWAMLHLGMGRIPARYDPLADRISEAQIDATLSRMHAAITQMSKKMPPHDVYMTGLLRYLKEKHG